MTILSQVITCSVQMTILPTLLNLCTKNVFLKRICSFSQNTNQTYGNLWKEGLLEIPKYWLLAFYTHSLTESLGFRVPCSEVWLGILTLSAFVGEGACIWVGVWAVLEEEVFTPAVFGADFLSPLPVGAAAVVTLCNVNLSQTKNVYTDKPEQNGGMSFLKPSLISDKYSLLKLIFIPNSLSWRDVFSHP